MKILAIDTSHGICSIALADNGIIIASKTDFEPSKQAERLFSSIETLLKEAEVSYADINAITVDIGPGSFTGIRIGLAAARGVSLAADIPVIGITGFEALALSQKESKDLLVALDAKRGQVYAQLFSKGTSACEEMMVDYGDITSIVSNTSLDIIGDGAQLIATYLNDVTHNIIIETKLPNAEMVALAAFEKIKGGNYQNNPAPLYIRKPDAKLPVSINSRNCD